MTGFCTHAVTATSHQAALGPAGEPELSTLIKAITAQRQLTLPIHRERHCPAREHPAQGAKHKVCLFPLVWNHLEHLCSFPVLTAWRAAGQEAPNSSQKRFARNYDKCVHVVPGVTPVGPRWHQVCSLALCWVMDNHPCRALQHWGGQGDPGGCNIQGQESWWTVHVRSTTQVWLLVV